MEKKKIGMKVDGKFMLCSVEEKEQNVFGKKVRSYSISDEKEEDEFETLSSPTEGDIEQQVVDGKYRSLHERGSVVNLGNLERSIPDQPIRAKERRGWDRRLEWVSDYRDREIVIEGGGNGEEGGLKKKRIRGGGRRDIEINES